MTTNGNSLINGIARNGAKPSSAKLWQELSGLGVAEVMGAVVSVGVIAFADKIAPEAMKSTTKAISKVTVEPFLDQWEWGLTHLCHLKECQPDKSKSREARAEAIAHTLVVFGAAFVPSLTAKLLTRRGINEFCGQGDGRAWWKILPLEKHTGKVFAWDEGVHLGSAAFINIFGAKTGDKIIDTTSSIFQKTFGWDEKRAKDVAAMLTVYELPNFLGLAAGSGYIIHSHLNNTRGLSHVERLNHSTSLGSHLSA